MRSAECKIARVRFGVDFNRNCFWEKRFRWHNPSLGRPTVTVVSKQQTWTKQSLPQRNLCVGCQLKSDLVISSLCLKGHVRARGSMLWQHRWQEARSFLCTQTPLFGESWTTKNMTKKTGNALSDALLMSCFQNFAADAAKKTALLAVFENRASRCFN